MASASSDLQVQGPRGRDWANLMAGPAGLIAERLLAKDVGDYFRFRAVCRAWRASSAILCARGALDRRFHPRRWGWIMLTNAFNVRFRRRFMSVHTGERILLEIPDIHRCYVLGSTAEGLVLVCRTDTYAVQLLNQLTGQIAGLPHAATLLGTSVSVDSGVRDLNLRSAGLVDDDSTVALHIGNFSLAITKPGGETWTRLTFQDRIMSALPFAGHIYCATANNVSVVETMAGQPPQLVVVAHHNLDTTIRRHTWLYLADHDGKLVLSYYATNHIGDLAILHDDSDGDYDYYGDEELALSHYCVKLDTSNMVPLARLDGQALFIGTRCSLLVAAGVSPSIRDDTVYFCGARPQHFAVDLLGESVEPCCFRKGDAAYDLSCYTCRP